MRISDKTGAVPGMIDMDGEGPDARTLLMRELREVRDRGIARVENNTKRLVKLDLPLLRERAEVIVGPGVSFTAAVKKIIEEAIEGISEGVLKLVAYRLFGLDRDLTLSKTREWRQEALRLYQERLEESQKGVVRYIGLDEFKNGPETDAIGLVADEIEVIAAASIAKKIASRGPIEITPRADDLVMESAEAVELVATLLPETDSQDHFRLAWTLGNRKYVIEQACAFLSQESRMNVLEFCRLVARDAGVTIDSLAIQEDRALTVIYQRIADRLSRENPRSLRLLEALAFVSHRNVPIEYLASHLLREPFIRRADVSFAVMTFQVAARPLLSYGLIQIDGSLVNMNSLTQAVFRSLFWDRIGEICDQLVNLFDIRFEQLRDNGWGAFTSAGRFLCNKIISARLHDHYARNDELMNRGLLAGAEWNVLVETLWLRVIGRKLIVTMAAGARVQLEDGGERGPVNLMRAGVTSSHPIQAAEIERMAEVYPSTEHARTPRSPRPASGEDADSAAALFESIGEFVEQGTKRDTNSRFGQLDFGMIFPDWNEVSRQDVIDYFHQD
jgi:hypothetical protein